MRSLKKTRLHSDPAVELSAATAPGKATVVQGLVQRKAQSAASPAPSASPAATVPSSEPRPSGLGAFGASEREADSGRESEETNGGETSGPGIEAAGTVEALWSAPGAQAAPAAPAPSADPIQMSGDMFRGAVQHGISTPIPKGAKINTTSATVTIANPSGAVTVELLPDKTNPAMKPNAAVTNTRYVLHGATWYARGGRITSSVPFTASFTVQTSYGANVSKSSPSSYGRGTTAKDKRDSNTSLGFHEGRHGVDTMEYLRKHPLPVFAGKVGQRVKTYKKAMRVYKVQIEAYVAKLKAHSEAHTDCVGVKGSGMCK